MSALSNGGVSQLAQVALMPMQDAVTGACGLYAFDPLFGFNDPVNASVYFYKVEEVMHGRTPTITRIIVTYRDLGLVKVNFTLTGNDDAGNMLSSQIDETLGNVKQTNLLLTKFIFPNSAFTAQNIQLRVFRAANAGALSIIKTTLCGRIERQEFA